MKKSRLLPIMAVLLAQLLFACNDTPQEEKTDFLVGEAVSAYWFDFTADRIEAVDFYGDYACEEGMRLVVCELSIENTFDDAVSMGWADFTLEWVRPESAPDEDEMEGAYALPPRAQGQFPDEYTLEADAVARGSLVFEVPEQVSEVALTFQELYAEGQGGDDYTEGSCYRVWASLNG